jgi:hypothetical protein
MMHFGVIKLVASDAIVSQVNTIDLYVHNIHPYNTQWQQ